MADEDTIAELRKIFEYDPDTGFLYRIATVSKWGIHPCLKVKAEVQGASHGYLEVTYRRKKYLVHRLIWALIFNYWPNIIDHIDRNRRNNKLENLRDCDQSINLLNGPLRINNQTGIAGVQFHQNGFMVRIAGIYVGMFYDIEQARQAAESKRKELINA